MNNISEDNVTYSVSAGCHINDVMNAKPINASPATVSAGCHINDVMNLS